MKYRCENGDVFSADEAIRDVEHITSEAWGVKTTERREFLRCPWCNSDEMEEINDGAR